MTVTQASWPKGNARKPRTYTEGRVCENDECDTRISKYNRSELCFRHSPARFPRVRGVVEEK